MDASFYTLVKFIDILYVSFGVMPWYHLTCTVIFILACCHTASVTFLSVNAIYNLDQKIQNLTTVYICYRKPQQPQLSDEDKVEKARRFDFVQGLLMSTILDDKL